ncbi:glycine/betaine ABC transporter periplasmic protein [Acetobacter nitrogenifigens DSM 23921 = NBRC 105050]|uniref:ABC-type glycine betaine transport system substrate-binding domain-containing protein n=1 Tax=Acetobacter nitrogenifigens DSM 23921 = NBRC 105050 TaxID=1120919 RepID=A0A511XA35_9PROT|nr:glycine betaine ABC transporter substrate-binding protein [Acetobacter nitrogenifigens]GBQ97828.1 glycine/betaine ABC transporter periplasmic protein [Acetobacter nitrogenifigens DSM 23921 = NBRC 105050]GEN59785.1 hypothetical protein ANI02nite_16690 [Acetobacter nitrogenifigens DSM 23921 = NBRC 105050]
MTTLTLGYRNAPEHAAVAAAVARVLEAHDMEPEYVTGPDQALTEMLESGELDVFATAWLPSVDAAWVSETVEARGDLYRPTFCCCVADTPELAGVASLSDLAASSASRNLLVPASVLPRVRQMVGSYGLTEAGFTIEAQPDEEAFEALAAAFAAGEPVVAALFAPNFLLHRYALRTLNDPRGALGGEQTAQLLINRSRAERLDSDLLDELDELTLGNRVVSALDDAVRHGGMTADDAAEAWQRGRLLPR